MQNKYKARNGFLLKNVLTQDGKVLVSLMTIISKFTMIDVSFWQFC